MAVDPIVIPIPNRRSLDRRAFLLGIAALPRTMSGPTPTTSGPPRYGNFDTILDHCSRSFKLYSIPHARYAVIYWVPMLIVC